ncbi:MAG: mycofactocin precursor MftA [Acidimicrobiaceae bacterium]|nr:mycofactocin precursor MftA [Acidimicrobiia bacterium]MCY4492965.1 mycofactocin precursor MftA [Acidimicrobiaceae bacterium]
MKPIDSPTPANPRVSPTAADATSGTSGTSEFIEEELLVEEISIDGMCGVY